MPTMITVMTKPCMICYRRSEIKMPQDAYDRWKIKGLYIQDAWPDGSPEEREMLLTGTHPDCWDKAFPEEDE